MKQHDQINWNRITVTIGITALFLTTFSFAKDGETIYKTVCHVCHGTWRQSRVGLPNQQRHCHPGKKTSPKGLEEKRHNAYQRRKKLTVG